MNSLILLCTTCRQFFLVFVFALVLSSCSIAPLSSPLSPRPYGAGKAQFEVHTINNQFVMKAGLGLSESFDMGYVMEFGELATSAIFARYNLINTAFSSGLELTYSDSESSKAYGLGLQNSLRLHELFEIFFGGRIVSLRSSATDLDLNTYYGNVLFEHYETTYFMYNAGFLLWINEFLALSPYVINFQGEHVRSKSITTSGVAFVLRL